MTRALLAFALIPLAACTEPPFTYTLRVEGVEGVTYFYEDRVDGGTIELDFPNYSSAYGTEISYIARIGELTSEGVVTIRDECLTGGPDIGAITSESMHYALNQDFSRDFHGSWIGCTGEEASFENSRD